MVRIGATPVAVPVTETICSAPGTDPELSINSTSPLNAPVVEGLKVTERSQLPPGATMAQLVGEPEMATENCAESGPAIGGMFDIVSCCVPMLVSVIPRVVVVPSGSVPKFTTRGET